MYSEYTRQKEGKVTASSPYGARLAAKQLAAKTELHLSASYITKIEVQVLGEWREVK